MIEQMPKIDNHVKHIREQYMLTSTPVRGIPGEPPRWSTRTSLQYWLSNMLHPDSPPPGLFFAAKTAAHVVDGPLGPRNCAVFLLLRLRCSSTPWVPHEELPRSCLRAVSVTCTQLGVLALDRSRKPSFTLLGRRLLVIAGPRLWLGLWPQ